MNLPTEKLYSLGRLQATTTIKTIFCTKHRFVYVFSVAAFQFKKVFFALNSATDSYKKTFAG